MSFPKDIAPDDLANDFGNFFMQKIDKINQLIDMQNSSEMSKAGEKGYADSDTLSQEQGPDRVATTYIFSCLIPHFDLKF